MMMMMDDDNEKEDLYSAFLDKFFQKYKNYI